MLLYAPYTAFVLARHVCDLVCQQAALATYIFHLQSSILTKQKAINRLVKMDKENSKPRKNERKSRLKLVTSTATTAKPVIKTEVYTLNIPNGDEVCKKATNLLDLNMMSPDTAAYIEDQTAQDQALMTEERDYLTTMPLTNQTNLPDQQPNQEKQPKRKERKRAAEQATKEATNKKPKIVLFEMMGKHSIDLTSDEITLITMSNQPNNKWITINLK